jgi:hypothetical protein
MAMKEEQKLKVFETRAEENTGTLREEAQVGGKELHSEELHTLCS